MRCSVKSRIPLVVAGRWLLASLACVCLLWLSVGCSGDVTLTIQGCEECPERCLSKDGAIGRCVRCLKDDHCRSKDSPTRKCSKDNRCLCGSDADCSKGQYCAGTGGCVACLKDEHCTDKSKPVCIANRCEVCSPNSSRACAPDGLKVCSKGVQVCKANNSWETCKDYKVCKDDEKCVDEKCVPDCPQPPPCQPGQNQCITNASVQPGRYKACVRNALGCLDYTGPEQSCALDEYCAKGRCIKATCPAGFSECSGKCVDLKSNRAHCGRCDNACSQNQVCNAGKCAVLCSGGKTECRGACVELQNNQYHCGKCDNVCNTNEECKQGRCVPRCSNGTTLCNGKCVNLKTDVKHCGRCGVVCSNGRVCAQAACVCPKPLLQCNGSCINPNINSSHCGRCNRKCVTGQLCVKGLCTLVCPAGTQACGGSCVDVRNNTSHCGKCGNVCNSGESCVLGACKLVCPTGFKNCNGSCVDTARNTSHCGGCGKACKAGEQCRQGSCTPLCSSRETLCAGQCVETKTNNSHCGRCGVSCSSPKVCSGGVCVCSGGAVECGGKCVDTQSDNQNCGGCGKLCTTGTTCQKGVCILQCTAGKTACNNTCVDTSTSLAHCGACGKACVGTQTCVAGTCQGAAYSTMDVGPFGTQASFTARTRGFWFKAPADFTIVGLRVPTDIGTGVQSVAVVRFVSTPPLWTLSNPQFTNAFSQLFYKKGVTGTTWIPATIAIKKGQIVGILGARGNGSLRSSYGQTNTYKTKIKGQSTELFRLIFQGGLDVSQPSSLANATGKYSRIEIRYR